MRDANEQESRVTNAASPIPAFFLLAAFEPFNGAAVNASLEVAHRLAENDPALDLVVLPVVRGEAERVLLGALAGRSENNGTAAPRLVIALGEAGNSAEVRLEKVAVNWDDFRIPDNAGNQPRDEAIVSDGPAAYFATLPVARIAADLAGQTPVPVVVSLSAGSFVCNHFAYAVLHALATKKPATGTPLPPAFGFIHVPALRPETERDASLTLDAIAATVRAVLDAATAAAI